MKRCKVPRCPSKHHSHGYCSKHSMRWKRHGDPLITKAINIADWSRQHRGDDSPNCKVSDEVVELIRSSTASQRVLATRYGISRQQVARIQYSDQRN